ncbi:MAG: ABC transporter ATP-binding protein [Candidatus Promineofilum sp.]|nr:ABC transporter ATP-binding protein [Promineifilum sp.]
MLKLETVSARYGMFSAIQNVSIEVGQGEFISIIGPNGAGKTTLFRTISGTLPISSGKITFEGVDLATVAAARRAHMGIAHVPEGRQVFTDLTVEENLLVGSGAVNGRGQVRENFDSVYTLFPILAERRTQLAGTLSGGQQQMLAIGRGLISSPRLLMLDEPSMGVAPTLVDLIFDTIRKLHQEHGITVLIVEQRAIEAIEACDRGYVLSSGGITAAGTRGELLANPQIRSAYLGA